MKRVVIGLGLLFVLGCGSAKESDRLNFHGPTAAISATLVRPLAHGRSVSLDGFGNIFVTAGSRLSEYSSAGDSLRSITGYGDGHYEFNEPVKVDGHAANLVLVTDRLNHRIEVYSRTLAYLSTIATRSDVDRAKRFGYPIAAAADGSGNIFVLDGEGIRVVKFRADQTFATTFGGYAESARPESVLSNPVDLATTEDGKVLVLDGGGSSLVEFDNFGSFIARVQLVRNARAIAVASDSVFALCSDSAASTIDVYALASLSMTGRWVLPDGFRVVRDLDVRSGQYLLLTDSGFYRLRAGQ